ncbi:hypothetical protein, partial [Corynebacterium variabile]|uniref:hypothetical protein n=1 Tax=Corynebacterium variabile TaxID=1727 RepID=UPI0028EA1898
MTRESPVTEIRAVTCAPYVAGHGHTDSPPRDVLSEASPVGAVVLLQRDLAEDSAEALIREV